MKNFYIISTRKKSGDRFVAEPGGVHYLRVPKSESRYTPAHSIKVKEWVDEVRGLADGDENPYSISPKGDILFFVHGYNNTQEVIFNRLKMLHKDLRAEGWRGVVVAFDWPSWDQTLNYLEDRSDAAAVSSKLVSHCLKLLANGQQQGCETNIHLLGHSTGAYLIMEGFSQAMQKKELYQSNWRIGQVAFIGGDVSAKSLQADSDWSTTLYKRIMRLTNYSNGHDAVLGVSNAKRLGVAPRAGRVGVDESHPKAVNVDCSSYFEGLDPDTSPHEGTFCHSWHIGNRVFARDLAMTMEGAIDRNYIPTRKMVDGRLVLIDAPRPAHMDKWGIDEMVSMRNDYPV
ncbi:MAG: alpha/beta hydrolase [Thalassospira sp.]|uniref:alpha/beta hydrolase n=1 Tax=Thalassospira sp. TaxID=1912094 RepID=UPI0032EBCB96